MFAYISLQTRLLIGFLTTTLFALSVISFIHFYSAREQLRNSTIERLVAIREEKKTEIENAFRDMHAQCLTISESVMSFHAMNDFREGFNALDVSDAEFEQYKKELTKFYEEVFLPKINETSTTKKTLSDFFPQDRKTIILQALYIARNPNSLESKREYNGIGNNTIYDKSHMLYHSIYMKYVMRFGYSDIYFIDETGYVIFSIGKAIDFGTNLLTGPLKDSLLADTFRDCQKTSDENYVKITDFTFYDPLYGTPTSFIGTPLFFGGKKLGVLVFQLPISTVNNIMTYNKRWADVGLGNTGEVYLRGADKLMRSISRFFIEDRTAYINKLQELHIDPDTIDKIKIYNTTILLQHVGQALEKVTDNKQSGTVIDQDYLGDETLLSYAPVVIAGLQWTIVAKISTHEAFAPIKTLTFRTIIWSLIVMILALTFSFILVHFSTAPLTLLSREVENNPTASPRLVTQAESPYIGGIALAYNNMVNYIQTMQKSLHMITDKSEHIKQIILTQTSTNMFAHLTTPHKQLDEIFVSMHALYNEMHLLSKQTDFATQTIVNNSNQLQVDEKDLHQKLNTLYAEIHKALNMYNELYASLQYTKQNVMSFSDTEDVKDAVTRIQSILETNKTLAHILSDQLFKIEQLTVANSQILPLRLEKHKELCAATDNIKNADKQRIALQESLNNAITEMQRITQDMKTTIEKGAQQMHDMHTIIDTLPTIQIAGEELHKKEQSNE